MVPLRFEPGSFNSGTPVTVAINRLAVRKIFDGMLGKYLASILIIHVHLYFHRPAPSNWSLISQISHLDLERKLISDD